MKKVIFKKEKENTIMAQEVITQESKTYNSTFIGNVDDDGNKFFTIYDSDKGFSLINVDGLVCDGKYCNVSLEKLLDILNETEEEVFVFDSFKELITWAGK